MSIRETLNNNSAVATIVAVVLLVVALGVIVWQNKGPSVGTFETFYYDLNTQEIFVDDGRKATPFDRGTGTFEYFDGAKGSAVRAYIYTCGDPEAIEAGMSLAEIEAAGGFIAYLERMTPEMLAQQAQIEAGQELSPEQYEYEFSSPLIAGIDGRVWLSQESSEASEMMGALFNRCGAGQRPSICRP